MIILANVPMPVVQSKAHLREVKLPKNFKYVNDYFKLYCFDNIGLQYIYHCKHTTSASE